MSPIAARKKTIIWMIAAIVLAVSSIALGAGLIVSHNSLTDTRNQLTDTQSALSSTQSTLADTENSLSAARQLELKQFLEDSARFYRCQRPHGQKSRCRTAEKRLPGRHGDSQTGGAQGQI